MNLSSAVAPNPLLCATELFHTRGYWMQRPDPHSIEISIEPRNICPKPESFRGMQKDLEMELLRHVQNMDCQIILHLYNCQEELEWHSTVLFHNRRSFREHGEQSAACTVNQNQKLQRIHACTKIGLISSRNME